jgi:hypothetical protein
MDLIYSRRYKMIGRHDPWHMPRSYLLHCHNLIKYMQTIDIDVVSFPSLSTRQSFKINYKQLRQV